MREVRGSAWPRALQDVQTVALSDFNHSLSSTPNRLLLVDDDQAEIA